MSADLHILTAARECILSDGWHPDALDLPAAIADLADRLGRQPTDAETHALLDRIGQLANAALTDDADFGECDLEDFQVENLRRAIFGVLRDARPESEESKAYGRAIAALEVA